MLLVTALFSKFQMGAAVIQWPFKQVWDSFLFFRFKNRVLRNLRVAMSMPLGAVAIVGTSNESSSLNPFSKKSLRSGSSPTTTKVPKKGAGC